MTGINREPGAKETALKRLLIYLLDKLTKLKTNELNEGINHQFQKPS